MAWLVHLFTASGAVLGLLALYQLYLGEMLYAFSLLALSILVDAVDGYFARVFQVKKRTPRFDGAMLDGIVDFENYVLVPAMMLLVGAFIEPPYNFLAAACLVLASCYQFCHLDSKTSDNFFRGFPSYWSILVFYFYILETGSNFNLVTTLICAGLSFVPLKFIYPSRMPMIMGSNLLTRTFQIMTWVWGVAVVLELIFYPFVSDINKGVIIGYTVIYTALSLYLQWVSSSGSTAVSTPVSC